MSSKYGEVTTTTPAPEIERFECPLGHWWSKHRGYCPVCYDKTGEDVAMVEIKTTEAPSMVGQSADPITVCKDCHRIITGNHNVVDGHRVQMGC